MYYEDASLEQWENRRLEYDDVDLDCRCNDCRENEQKIDDIADYLKVIIGYLYDDNKFDPEELEVALEEVSWLVGIKTPDKPLQITSKEALKINMDDLLNEWVAYNNQHMRAI
jgi:hypothetical protein